MCAPAATSTVARPVVRRCADMCVEPSDVTLLVMAWAMGAARMGYITRQEWMAAVPRLGGATTAPALQEELRTLHQALLRDIERFRDLHAFTHRFCREERRKTIDVRRAARYSCDCNRSMPHRAPYLAALSSQLIPRRPRSPSPPNLLFPCPGCTGHGCLPTHWGVYIWCGEAS